MKEVHWYKYGLWFLVFLFTACNPASDVEEVETISHIWTDNFNYTYSVSAETYSQGLISYKLYNAENITWYYPITHMGSYYNAPLYAINATLQEVCNVLNLPIEEVLDLTVDQQRLATLDLPSAIIPGVKVGDPSKEIEALVLTLTEFSDVDRVQLTFGSEIQSFIGDYNMNDISLPLNRIERYNDNVYYQGQGLRMVFYWLHRESGNLVPVTHIIESGMSIEEELEYILDLLMQVPEAQRSIASSTMLNLNNHLESALAPFWQAGGERPKISLHGQLLQINLDGSLLLQYRNDPRLVQALTAMTRTFLDFAPATIHEVQFLVNDRPSNLSFGLFSLAEPITALPFINVQKNEQIVSE